MIFQGASKAPSMLVTGRYTRMSVCGKSACRQQLSSVLCRHLTTEPPTGHTVALSFDHYPAPKVDQPQQGRPGLQTAGVKSVILAHGLFGSKQNWRSVARDMAKRFEVPIYAVDLRNHGSSPTIDGMNYADMAKDLVRFFEEHSLEQTLLVGHSMGGKAALATGLSPCLPPNALAGLVSVDMAPSRGTLSNDFIVCLLSDLNCADTNKAHFRYAGLSGCHDRYPRCTCVLAQGS